MFNENLQRSWNAAGVTLDGFFFFSTKKGRGKYAYLFKNIKVQAVRFVFINVCVCVYVCVCVWMPADVLSCFSYVDSLWPVDWGLPGFSVMGFSGQEYWSGLPCPPPGDLPNLGMEPASHVSCIGRQLFLATSANWKVSIYISISLLWAQLCVPIYIWKFH